MPGRSDEAVVAALVLAVGCGALKYHRAMGIDRIAGTAADVVVDLDHFPYPFRDNSFDEVRAIHVIEHVADVIRTMEEFHRLLRNGGAVVFSTPPYTHFSSFFDPPQPCALDSFFFRYFRAGKGALPDFFPC